ncbi:hypothetical protein SLEP1_g26698 [Rubroshorea leprosula]|uniref:Uncharacterized protein n=1 Tax=Rubroshorea leprosula TaxID=152421 RepID=A0AAV5JXJ5_9ROSI|nr:hypothetical protein SLEP1_g26698 [Rubroshorea leprosula]
MVRAPPTDGVALLAVCQFGRENPPPPTTIYQPSLKFFFIFFAPFGFYIYPHIKFYAFFIPNSKDMFFWGL